LELPFLDAALEQVRRTSRLPIGNKRLTIEIRTQTLVGDHRVDFLLLYYGTDFVREGQGRAKGEEWREIRVDERMIVECDGHEFHEKTKEQAQRDKERDRKLQSLGFRVYRYTGSELYADAFRCAAEILRHMTGRDFGDDDGNTGAA
jgi:very-short-patch-repair endonuclease